MKLNKFTVTVVVKKKLRDQCKNYLNIKEIKKCQLILLRSATNYSRTLPTHFGKIDESLSERSKVSLREPG